MYQAKLVGVYILFVTAVCVRCSIFPFHDYDYGGGYGRYDRYNYDRPVWGNCDTENKDTLDEIKSEIQKLQQLVVGLRQKVDPDFKLPSPPESKCPPGFQYVVRAHSCYKVVYEEHNWIAAGQRCQELHPEAHLAVITKHEESIGLTAYLEPEIAKHSHRIGSRFQMYGGGSKLWTSGQRLNETSCTDEFVWKMANSTQLPLSFTNWDRNEPNCHDDQPEGCLELRSARGFKWNDVPCDLGFFPLCEFDPL